MGPSARYRDRAMSDALDPFQRHSLRTSMFFPASRLMVAGNPKAAGTSLRWWLLPLHGIDVESRTERSLWGESAPFQTVWDVRVDLRFAWNDLADGERADALESTDVLTVQPVRHPVTRAFSAWSGKYLNAEPYYSDRLPAEFPSQAGDVGSRDEVAERFAAFVHALSVHVDQHGWLDLDVHFWPQHLLLGRRPVGEVLVLRQESLAQGLGAVRQHLETHGVTAGEAPRINETIVGYQPDLVTGQALQALAQLYAEDFTAWDYLPEAPAARARDLDLDWLNDVRGRNRRYQVIHEAAMRGQARERELLDDLTRARSREHELLASTSWRLTRPVRAASDALRRVRRRQ